MISAISAFDLDFTLLNANSSYRFGRYLYENKHIPYSSLLYIYGCVIRHSLGILPIHKLHEGAFAWIFKGRSEPLMKEWASDFIMKNLDTLLYLPAIERLKESQAKGHLTVLLSSGPDFLVKKIANFLNIPLCHATQYAVDKDHRFCHISSLLLGRDKAKVLVDLRREHGIPTENTYAYSDSHLDLPFLQAAGQAVGVNPNRRLRALCLQNQWPII